MPDPFECFIIKNTLPGLITIAQALPAGKAIYGCISLPEKLKIGELGFYSSPDPRH